MKRLLALALLAATPALAQSRRIVAQNNFASDFQTVPVMGNVVGASGARFQTSVAILNPTDRAFAVDVTLYDATGTPRTATLNLSPGQLRTYANFLDAVFAGYNGGGAVTFRAAETTGGTHNNRFIVTTQNYTAGTQYGTAIPSLEFAGSSSPSFAAGISVDSNWRTNVGCFNQSSSRNRIAATVFDNSGRLVVGKITLDLAPNAWGQSGLAMVVTDGFVRFEPEDSAVCYASVVNNATNDAQFITAAEYAP